MDCTCGSDKTKNTAVVNALSLWPLTEEQGAFLVANAGKLVCYNCGGWVSDEWRRYADHVTGGAVVSRLLDLGVFDEQTRGAN